MISNPDVPVHLEEGCTETQCSICKTNKSFELPSQIVDACNSGQLIIFAGAGISTESKNVYPSSLYQDIKNILKIPEDENIVFSKLMSLYCSPPRSRKDLLLAIKERIDYVKTFPELYNEATKFHRELSTIPHIHEIFTTNWDDFFERECDATPIVTGEDYAVFEDIPGRKVFKLHGSIYNYGSIVATEKDYKKCYNSLKTGIVGAKLKTHFLSKTMIFIGFSFDDEDFQKLYKLLSKDVQGLIPTFYAVTLDEKAEEKLTSLKIKVIPIITNGSFFIKKLKENLAKQNQMIPDEHFSGIEELLYETRMAHQHITSALLRKYPDSVYSLMYQDGLQHSFEHILTNGHSGLASNPERAMRVIDSYDYLIKLNLKSKHYLDVAYFTGYQLGQLFFVIPPNERPKFPFYYLFGYDDDIMNYKKFVKLLKEPTFHKSAHKYAEKIISNIKSDDIVIHRRPI